MPELILPEIVYNVTKKLDCIFVFRNYNIEERTIDRAGDVMCSDARGARSTTGES